ncbi:MAG: Hsp20/alpha crystallin family protein [Acidimicrobiales bacterium]
MLMRFDPFAELDRLAAPTRSTPVMPMDAFRRGDAFTVALDVPGVDPATIDLTVEKDVLTVRAERAWRPQQGDEVLVTERRQGTFSRQLFLGEALDSDRIEARYEHGVLCITIPVAERAKPRKVTVSTGDIPEAVEAASGQKSSPVEATSTEKAA